MSLSPGTDRVTISASQITFLDLSKELGFAPGIRESFPGNVEGLCGRVAMIVMKDRVVIVSAYQPTVST